jgi:hypothetical protein
MVSGPIAEDGEEVETEGDIKKSFKGVDQGLLQTGSRQQNCHHKNKKLQKSHKNQRK